MPYLQPFEKKIYITVYKPPFPRQYTTLAASKVHTNFFTIYFCVVHHTKTQRNFFITIEILDSCEQKATLYINILAISTKALRKAGSHVARVAKNGVKVYNRHKANSLVFNSKQKISLNCLLSSI
ncbi:hypothetical protein B7982_07080 [Fibrobacter sp. UWB2]|nr:hypothetical protein B7982_07080 [Fibrobacter sp. UWB2]